MNLFRNDDNFIKSKKLFYPDCPNHNELLCGKMITKDKFKKAIKKIGRAARKFTDIKNGITKKIIHEAANNDAINSIIQSVPVVGDALSSVIKVGDKVVTKLNDVSDKIKKKEYLLKI